MQTLTAIRRLGLVVCLLAGACATMPAASHGKAIDTKIMVHAVARDAKVIGTHVGNARITITDVNTGEVLATGLEEGGTGDTKKIMVEPHKRGQELYTTEGTAHFLATLKLARPTVVRVTAEAPLGSPQATMTASKTLLVVPGVDFLGDGVTLELNGLIVTIQKPETKEARAGEAIPIEAKVTMMCGCPTEPDGLWDSKKMNMVARLVDGAGVVAESPLEYAGKKSEFKGAITAPRAGRFTLEVVATQPTEANAGIDRRTITVK